VPAAWVTYEVIESDLKTVWPKGEVMNDTPPIAVMEALVMAKKAKRIAAVHTFNTVHQEDDDEDESLFGDSDEDEDEDE
jgi:hypothetical protein